MRRPALVPMILLLAFFTIASAGATEIEGTQTDALFGFSQAVGDFNGDGVDDLVVGAPNYDNSGTDRGAAFIFLGPFSDDLDTGDANGSYIGVEEYDRAGFALASGDLNGDGFDDIVVGCPGNDDNLPNSGKVYVIFGRRSFSTMSSLSGANGSFIGKDNSDRTGMSLACGDVNGDGYDDVIIGTPREDGNDGANSGAVYIIHGKSGKWNMEKSLYNADASYIGTALGQQVGVNVTCGDVNGDGMADIVMGAPYHTRTESEEGMVYVAFGRTSSWKLNTRVSTLNASFLGGTSGAHLGWSLSAGFDADGDELGDLLIGAPGIDEVYMFRGRQGWGRRVLPSRADITVEGDSGTNTGWSVGMDIYDRDLTRGLLVGSPGNGSANGSFAFLPRGSEGNLSNGTVLDGSTGSLFGWSIASGDMDGDGLMDAVVTGPNATGSTTRNGIVVITEYAMNIQPFITSISLHRNISRDRVFFLRLGQPVIINASGGTGSPERDVVWAHVWTPTDPAGIDVPLLETGGSTGLFQGNVTPVYGSDEDAVRVAARWGDWLNVSFGPIRTRGMLNVPPVIVGNDTLTVDEDSPYESRYTYLDGNADFVSWTIVTDATWMIWSDWNQTLWGTPDNRHVGNFTVSIRIEDGNLGNDSRSFNLTVNNTPPNIGNADVTVAFEGVEYNVTYYVAPPEIGSYWTFSTDASWLDFEANGTYLWGTPANEDVGTYSVNISVRDGNGGYDNHNFTIDVRNTPLTILTSDILSVDQDEYYYNDYNSTDDPGPKWNLSTDADFLSINTSSGEVYGTPNNWDVGNWTVNMSVEDIHGAIAFSNFTLRVFNIAPVISLDDPIIAYEDDDFAYTLNFTDAGPGTTVTMVTNAIWLSDLDLTIRGRADDDDVGDYYFDLTVEDTWGASDTQNVTLRVINTDPEVLGTPPTSVDEDSSYTAYLSSTDPVDHWTMSGPSWLGLDPNGNLTGTPDNWDVRNSTVTVTVYDRHGGSGTLQFTLEVVNAPPEIAAEHPSSVIEGSTFTAWFNSSDSPAAWWWLVTPSEWLHINGNGVLTGVPTNRDVGPCVINITTGDGNRGVTSYIFNLTVMNTPPEIYNTPPVQILEDQVYSFEMNSSDDPWVTWSLESLADWLTVNSTGVLVGVPGNEDVAFWQFSLSVDDGNGGTDRLNFTVNVLNTDPEILSSPPGFAWEKDTYSFQMVSSDGGPIGWELAGPAWLHIDPETGLLSGIPTNDDVNDTNVTIRLKDGKGGTADLDYVLQVFNTVPVILTDPVNSTLEGVPFSLPLESTDDGTNTVWRVSTDAYWLTYNDTVNAVFGTPGELEIGTYYVNISVKDGFGGHDELNFTLEVVNAPPVLSIPYIPPLPEDEPFEAMIRSSDPVSKWEFFSDADWLGFNTTSGRLHGTPDNGDVGTWTANVTATDGYGMSASVELTIIVENTPPVITPYPPLDLIENELYRVDFNTTDAPENWTFEGPSWLSIDADSGILWGVPGDADFGVFEITVNVSDGNGGFAKLAFVIEVQNVNDAPVITGTDVPVTNATEPYLVEYVGTDPDGDTVTWGLVTNATFLTISSNGTLTGIPANDHEGAYEVSISLRDPSGNETWRNFTLIVLYKDLAPTLNGGTVTPLNGDTDTRFHFTVWYFDPEGAPPGSITVVIDGKERPMRLSKEEASNGLYGYSTTLSRGVHTYHFRANDGMSPAEPTGGTPTDTNPGTVGVKKGEDLSPVIFYDLILIAVLVAILVIALGYLVAPDRMSSILGKIVPTGGKKQKKKPPEVPSTAKEEPDPFSRERRRGPPPRRRSAPAVRPVARGSGDISEGEGPVREWPDIPEDPGPEIGPEGTRTPSGSGRTSTPIEEDEKDPLDMEDAVEMRYSDLPGRHSGRS